MSRRAARALALLAGCLLLGGGCSRSQVARIAFVGTPRAALGARFALRNAGELSGQGSPRFRLSIVVDYGASATAAIVTAESLAANPALLAVVGHASSTTSMAAARTYNSAHITELAPSTSAPAYSDAGPYSFRLIPSDGSQASFLAAQVPAGARVGVSYMNTDYGRALRRALRQALGRRGLAPVLEVGFNAPLDSIQTAALVADVAGARPDVLFWVGTPWTLTPVLPGIHRVDPPVIVYGSDAMEAGEIYDSLRDQLAGVRFVRFIDPEAPGREFQDLRRQYRAATGVELTYDVAYACDGVGLLVQALQAGARTRDDVRLYLTSLGRSRPAYQGLAGPITFDSTRTASRAYHLAEVTRQGVRPLRPH